LAEQLLKRENRLSLLLAFSFLSAAHLIRATARLRFLLGSSRGRCSAKPDTLHHRVSALRHLSHIGFIQFVIVSLDGALKLLFLRFVLLELLLDILFFLFLPLLELANPALIVDMAEAAPRQISARLKVIILLRFRFY